MKPLVEGTPGRRIVEDELRLLGRVANTLSALSSAHPGAPDYDEALVNLRDQIAEAKPEDLAALVEQMTRIAAIAQRYGKGRDLPLDLGSPYFAHLRLDEDDRVRDVLIGKRGFIDREHNVQIVDWRHAPVSRIYYRYEEGDDYEEHFGQHTLEGRIAARRTLTIEDGRLRRIGCPQGTFFVGEDGAWYQSDAASVARLAGGQGKAARPPVLRSATKGSRLGEGARSLRADKHLPEIAALIDPVQFDLITRPDSGLVVLQGGAGTGKTTVALHRVAYLNYAQPKRFRPEQMLISVPSAAMVRYVEHVLPSLDVRGVRVVTASEWFSRTRQRVLPHSPRRYLDDTPAVVLRFKKHPLLMRVAARYVREQQRQLREQLAAALEGRPGGDEVVRQWDAHGGQPLVARCRAVRRWSEQQRDLAAVTRQQVEGALARLTRRARDAFSDWAEILTDRALLWQGVQRHCPGAFSQRDIERVCEWCTRQSDEVPGASGEEAVDAAAFISLDGHDEREQPVAGRLDAPDDGLLLHLHLLKHGELRPPGGKSIRYEHVVVDEAQDLSAVEISVLVDASTQRRSVTLAGDSQQRLVFDNHFQDWESLLATLGLAASASSTLRLGYRSTAEVMLLARSLLGEEAAPDSTTPVRSGAPVELHRFGSDGEAVALLSDALRSLMSREPLASVALIARYPAQAEAYARALERAEVPSLRLVRQQDFSFRPGIEATHVAQVKGLEFDYVVLLDVTAANYPDTMESRHLLHIAATRAAHQLWIIATGQPSPVLPESL